MVPPSPSLRHGDPLSDRNPFVTSFAASSNEYSLKLPNIEPLPPLFEDGDFMFDKNALVTSYPVPSSQQSLRSSETSLELGLSSPKKPILYGPPPVVKKRAQEVGRFRYITFTIYRRIFTTVFIINMITLILLMVNAKGIPSRLAVNTASSANLMAAIVGRQENVVNWLYELACCVPHSLPLWIRSRLARIFHYGGIHSGCGAAATMWFLLQTILVTLEFPSNPSRLMLISLITSWSLILLLFIILLSAYPSFRRGFHNQFEMLHRFAGWFALAIFWAHLIIIALEEQASENSSHKRNFGLRLISTPSLWLLLVSTTCGLLSWSRLRLRDVYAERLSSHAIRLHFYYKDMPPFYGVKVSDDPVCEWHSFATIPNPGPKGRGFSVLVSNAGDWTSKVINNPPKQLWVRGYPIHGVSYTSQLFKRVVVVATGSGIGPVLSLFAAKATPCRVLWSTPNPLKTYGQRIIDEVLGADENAVIWNTREHGRPDLIAIVCHLVKEFDAEAVFCISNPPVTRKVVLEMNTRRVPAYGVIYDS